MLIKYNKNLNPKTVSEKNTFYLYYNNDFQTMIHITTGRTDSIPAQI